MFTNVLSIQSILVILLEMVCHLFFYVVPEVKSRLASRYDDDVDQ